MFPLEKTAIIKLCIVEDDAGLLANLSLLLGGEPGFEVVGAFNSAEAALAQMQWNRCNTLLVDLNLPGRSGVDLIQTLRTNYPTLQILVHTISEQRATVFAAIKAGAMGYLLKGSSPRDLIEALRNLHSGGAPMSAKIARKVILELQGQVAAPPLEPLSQRESTVLNGIALGKSYKELAVELGVSPHTIHAYVKRVYEKLQARNRSEILQKARVLGII
jgi:DNA-binding NarL/FixJ family response regulator